jgi:hypothetical protein
VGLPIQRDDGARGPVYQHRKEQRRRFGTEARLSSDRGCTTHDPGRSRTARAEVGSQDNLGVEQGDQCDEVTTAGCQEEGINDRALTSEVGVGDVCALTRRRALLASCLAAVGDRPTMGAISSNGSSNMSWSTKARRSAGARASSTTRRARPTESASSASPSGPRSPTGLMTGSGRCTSRDSTRRTSRERSILRQTRATIVVNHPPRFSTTLVSARLTRSQASWTASSASVSEPNIRKATARR